MNLRSKYEFLFLLFIIFLIGSCKTDTEIGIEQADTFIKFFGGSEDDQPKDVIKFNDGYAITGKIKTTDNDYQAFVIFTDKFGNEYPWSPISRGNSFNDT